MNTQQHCWMTKRRRLTLLSVAIVITFSAVVQAADALPGIVFVSDDILGPQHEMDGYLGTWHWREGYIYHRATTLHPLERTMTPTRPGRNLYTLVPARPDGKLTRITHNTEGQVFDPEPSYDGRKILFSMRPDGDDWFHLYQINVDGRGAVQLTDGPFNDVSGLWLPDGRIVFVSDRGGYLEEYHEERTETLWVMNGDGTGMEQLTFNPGTVYDPTVLADGRVCFSLWDVFMLNVPPLDKHETYLMTIRPDGTEERQLFGVRQYRFFNRERHSGFAMNQVGQWPDGTFLAQSEMGPAIIDLRRGPGVAEAVWPVFPATTSIQLGGATHRVHLSPTGSRSTPYPLPDGRFLFSATPPGARDIGVYLCDPRTRHVQLVFNDPLRSDYDARPILIERPRPAALPSKGKPIAVREQRGEGARERKREEETEGTSQGAKPPSEDAAESLPRSFPPSLRPSVPLSPDPLLPVTGRARFVISNARRSDNPEHERVLQRARYYRVIESLHNVVTSSSHTNLQTRILGVVPILDDGSVYFEAPADTPLFLEALDAAGNRLLFDWNYPVTSVPVGSKQALVETASFSARPNEVKSCNGCHAAEGEAAIPGSLLALAYDPVQVDRDVTDITYRRNEPDEYRCQARVGEAAKYRPWLSSPQPRLRRQACETLMAIEDGGRQAAPEIARLLRDQSAEVRRAAALALARLGGPEETAALRQALDDSDWQVRFHAASALEAITAWREEKGTEVFLVDRAEVVRRLLIQKDPRPVSWYEAVGRLGEAAPESIRQLVRQALEVSPPPPTQFEPAAGKQHHRQEGRTPDVAAIRAAGWIRDVPSVPLLAPWLVRHDYNQHATEAALALGRIGSPEAVEALWNAVRSEVPMKSIYLGRYFQHGPRPEEYTLLRALVLAGAAPKLEDVPLVIGLLPGTFLEKPRFEDRLRAESQRVLLPRRLLETGGWRDKAVKLLVAVLRGDSPPHDDPLYQQVLKGINLERPFSEHGRPFPVVKQIEPEQALWLLGCLVAERSEVPEDFVLGYLTSENHRERIDAAVLLSIVGVSQRGADALAAEIARPYGFKEIMSIGKGRLDPNFRDKCYMLMALARHIDDPQRLRPFAGPRTYYRDIRYGLALGLGCRGTPDGIDLLVELATRDPIASVRWQARESLRSIQETQLQAGEPVPNIELPEPLPYEAVYPPGPLDWPEPVVEQRRAEQPPEARTLEELEAAVGAGLDAGRYRNLNNTNNQAPGSKRMMVQGIEPFSQAVEQLAARFPEKAGPTLRRLLDSPYPFAHYLALRELAKGGHGELDGVLIAKLDAYARSADTVGFYWTCEALARRRVLDAVPALARYAQSEDPAGLHGPQGMGFGYPAAKALARLAGKADHAEVKRLLASDNLWLRAGTLAGLAESDDPQVDGLLKRVMQEETAALLRYEAAVGLRSRNHERLSLTPGEGEADQAATAGIRQNTYTRFYRGPNSPKPSNVGPPVRDSQ